MSWVVRDRRRNCLLLLDLGRGTHCVSRVLMDCMLMTRNISFPYTDFIPVRSKRRRGNRGKLEGISPIVLLRGLRDELEADKWFAQCKRPWYRFLVILLSHHCVLMGDMREYRDHWRVTSSSQDGVYRSDMPGPRKPFLVTQCPCTTRISAWDLWSSIDCMCVARTGAN